MSVERIRGFLLQLPKPALVRAFVDGEPEELKINRTYQRLAETIAALQPEQIQCLDSDGKVLRAMRLDDADSRRSDAAEVPPVLAQDPQAALLSHFANLLHRAYEHSTEIAFSKMVELVDRMNDRSAGIEQRLERAEAYARRLREEQADDAIERAEEIVAAAAGQEGGDLPSQLATAFLSGRLNRTATDPAKSNGSNGAKTNGAKTAGKGSAS